MAAAAGPRHDGRESASPAPGVSTEGSIVAPGVVGNEDTGVSFNADAAARQEASSSLVFLPTSLSSPSSLPMAASFAIEASDR